jgi:signal transduction histidine kinase
VPSSASTRGPVGVCDTSRIHLEAPEELPLVTADPDRLERVVVNVITNALKYSGPDSPVTVRLAPGEGEVIAAVADHGIGIPADELPSVFDRFYRARAVRERRDGQGLGLYISRQLVEAHGGRMWAASDVGRGSTFSFSLPVA